MFWVKYLQKFWTKGAQTFKQLCIVEKQKKTFNQLLRTKKSLNQWSLHLYIFYMQSCITLYLTCVLFMSTNPPAPQVIHLCKEESFRTLQNHLCRKSQRAGWAQNPHRRAAEHWPWGSTGCLCRPDAWSHRCHTSLWHSSSSEGCKCRGDLCHSRWSHRDRGERKREW